MKHFITLILILISNSLLSATKFDENDIKTKLPQLVGTTSAGRDYWFSIPPAYEDTPGQNFIRCFCVTPNKNKITLEILGRGKYETRSLNAGGLTVFDLSPAEGQPFQHTFGEATPPAQVYKGLGIHIFSDNPIVCYVMVRFKYTCDGFLCLPTNGLGKEYIAGPYTSSFWDGLVAWTLITAAYDNTKFTYTMGGDGNSKVETSTNGFLVAGQSVNASLQKGDVYVVGAYKNFMDIAGSKIVASKPVGVNTGIHCANIPLEVYACDYNAEMEIPTETWGKALLIPVCHDRSKPGLIRIFAKYPNTQIFRDEILAYTIKTSGGIKDIGYIETRVSDINKAPIPTIYTADKPISIMYYNPGTTDDPGSVNTDPFQMLILPVEQYQSDIMIGGVNAAGGEKISFSFLNICYELNELRKMPDDLEFGIWNGTQWVFKKLSSYDGKDTIFAKIPINGKYYGVKNISIPRDGVFKIRSLKGYKFAAYNYGFDYYDSYGFPTSTGLKFLESKDSLPPNLFYTEECDGSIGIIKPATVTDIYNDQSISSNLSEAYMIKDINYSYNYIFKIGEIVSGETSKLNWTLNPINPYQDSKATLVFKDRAGNDTIIQIEHFANILNISKSQSFGNFKIGDEPVTKDFWLINGSKRKENVINLHLLKDNVGFKLTPIGWTLPKSMNIGDSLLVKVTFTPDTNLIQSGALNFVDSIGVGDDCNFGYKIEVRAGIGEPEIQVEDTNFGQENIDKNVPNSRILRILNNSKGADLAITGFSSLNNSVFTTNLDTLYPNISKTNPMIIPSGKFNDTIIFISDSKSSDNICLISGEGIVDLGIEDINLSKILPFTPNPVKDRLYIKVSEFKGSETIQIINILGTKLIECDMKESIDVSKLASGVYYLKIDNSTYKFVKE